MSTEPYVGEIRWLPFSRAPQGWLLCDGSLQPIDVYQTLYTLISTTYGGDGVSNFAVPDLRGRVPLHQGTGQGLSPRVLGASAGSETITLTSTQTGHTHTLVASANPATLKTAAKDTSLATVAAGDSLYCNGPGTGQSATLGNSISSTGAGLPHDNCAPTLPVSAFICWAGVFPSQG